MNARFYNLFTFFIVFFSISILPLVAQDLNIAYLEGTLEYRDGNNAWTTLNIGDSIQKGNTVRLSGQGYAELSAGSKTVTLTRDGVYKTADLLGSGSRPERKSFRQILGSKFLSLFKHSSSRQSTAAAVRGASVESVNFIPWEDDSVSYLADGKKLFNKGIYVGAQNLFKEGSLWERGAVQRECVFRLGISEQVTGQLKTARKTLTSIKPEASDPYLAEYTISVATLYIESMEYKKADAVLDFFLKTNPPASDAVQAVWLLSAYSMEGQGDKAGTQRSLQKAVALGRDTEIGRAAAQMLK